VEEWECAEEPRPGVRVAEEAGPVIGVCTQEHELHQDSDVDAEGRGDGEATAAVAAVRQYSGWTSHGRR
jgi:hypothetical protein